MTSTSPKKEQQKSILTVIKNYTKAFIKSYSSCSDLFKTWKSITFRSILTRACKISCTKELLDGEFDRTERELFEINGYRKWITNEWNKK